MNSTESPVNFMNMLKMAQFMQFGQNPSTSTDNMIEITENGDLDLSQLLNNGKTSEDRPKPRKLGQEFRKSLEGYGFELVSQFVDNIKKEKIDYVNDSEILELKQQFDDINKNAVAFDKIQQFAENLKSAVDGISDDVFGNDDEDLGQPEAKRARPDSNKSANSNSPDSTPKQLNLMNMMSAFPFVQGNASMSGMNPEMFQALSQMFPMNGMPPSPGLSQNNSNQKRARTRITDDQLKVLRQYFDINNSPTEQQVKEMSIKAGLPEKVIKHWFRNTLFKERQRDKNSPYNFSVQPMMRIDLDTYEKTGEAKIIPLKQEDEEEELVESPIQEETQSNDAEEEKPEEESTPPNDLTQEMLKAASSMFNMPGMNSYAAAAAAAMAQNPFASLLAQNDESNPLAQFMNGFGSSMNSMISSPVSTRPASSTANASTTGRRANRTRFTDLQLKTLQDFFDKQAYPKDDDLEMLSKKLSLSPRVIVVWFQNARQKARKIYENQPNQDNTDRFIRTPGCNFQCKRCQLVFQRYYELIQHQQRVCYANDTDAQQTDNKSVEENMSDEERLQRNASSVQSHSESDKERRDSVDNNNAPQDLLKIIAQGKDGGEALLKMFANTQRSFSKRCPFCNVHFSAKDQLVDHINVKHADNPLAMSLNVDVLPEADDNSSFSTTEGLLGTISALTGGSPLDLSVSDSQKNIFDHDDPDGDDFSTNSFDLRALSASPHTLLSAFGQSPLNAVMGHVGQSQRSPANGSAGSKRYRTHLTPNQVFVMKSLFGDYKTPSMSECEVLGQEIGLHKRVVQVWFQNARAKQRKCGPGSVAEEGLCSTTSTGCSECKVEFNGRVTVQDHIFTPQHINKVKLCGAEIRGTGVEEMPERPRTGTKRSADDSSNGDDVALNPLLYTLMDPNMIGTPVQCLQIPESVMGQISTDMTNGSPSTTFTQDGLSLRDLDGKVSDEDFKCCTNVESEVGWACPQCSQVFQQECWLKNHQQLLCQGSEGVFKLVQQHYECIPCSIKFGTIDDYRSHCDQSSHKTKRQVFQSPSTCSTGSV